MTRDSRKDSSRAERAGRWGRARRWLTLVAAALLLASQVFLPADAGEMGKSTAGHGKQRLARDLIETIATANPGQDVRLVVKVGKNKAKFKKDVEALGGRLLGDYAAVDQMVLEMPLGLVETLAAAGDVEYVAPDRAVVGLASALQIVTGADQVYAMAAPSGTKSTKDKGKDSKHKEKDSDGGLLTGRGIAVAVIDSGIEFNRKDLDRKERILLSLDFTGARGPMDPYGHGTFVAGVIGGNGEVSSKSDLDFSGIAPGAGFLDLRVLDENGRGRLSDVIAAIDFAVAYRSVYDIRVLNLSLAAPPVDSYLDDPLCHAVARAVEAGIVVVTAAGNFGLDRTGQPVYGGITSPGISPHAITVGASDTRGTGYRSDDTVAPFSSRGPTWSGYADPVTGEEVHDFLPKPDLVAPGVGVVSLGRSRSTLLTLYPQLETITQRGGSKDTYMTLSGTSVSAGVVSGAVALMLQANPSLTPNMVKAILMYTAQILDGPDMFEQGAGLINVEGAVRVAAALRTSAVPLPPGQVLAMFVPPGEPLTIIAGEPAVWSQGLIWGRAWLTGGGVLSAGQLAYAQGLIWGIRRDAFSAGVIWSEGLYTDEQVVYGGMGQWLYAVWDQETQLASGVTYRATLSTTGVLWQNRLISDDFFSVESSSLIWGFGRFTDSQGLIWGINSMALIWGAF